MTWATATSPPTAIPSSRHRDDTAFFFAAIGKIDAQIGRLRETLTAEGLTRDTILIFMTDNGGTTGVKLFNAGMRGKKGDVHDGGHRVPCLIHWPAGGLRQGEDITSLNAHIDMLPTLVDLCGLKLPKAVDFDGRSFGAQLRDASAEVPDRTLFVERQRTFKPEKWRGAAAMTSRWRLVDDNALYDISEADAELAGAPAIHKTVDAWDAAGPKPDLLYGNAKTRFRKLPVASVRLTVGKMTQTIAATKGATECSFDFTLEKDLPLPVKAELLDSSGKTLAGACYVYCHLTKP